MLHLIQPDSKPTASFTYSINANLIFDHDLPTRTSNFDDDSIKK